MSYGLEGAKEVRRSKQIADLDRVNEFFNSPKIKEDLHWFTYRDTLERAYHREDRRVYYIEGDSSSDIIGALMVWCESRILHEDEAQIRLVAISPDHRHSGLGSALCSKAEDFASSYGQSLMIADVDAESSAVSFWKAMGYTDTKMWKTNNDREMTRVVKTL